MTFHADGAIVWNSAYASCEKRALYLLAQALQWACVAACMLAQANVRSSRRYREVHTLMLCYLLQQMHGVARPDTFRYPADTCPPSRLRRLHEPQKFSSMKHGCTVQLVLATASRKMCFEWNPPPLKPRCFVSRIYSCLYTTLVMESNIFAMHKWSTSPAECEAQSHMAATRNLDQPTSML